MLNVLASHYLATYQANTRYPVTTALGDTSKVHAYETHPLFCPGAVEFHKFTTIKAFNSCCRIAFPHILLFCPEQPRDQVQGFCDHSITRKSSCTT